MFCGHIANLKTTIHETYSRKRSLTQRWFYCIEGIWTPFIWSVSDTDVFLDQQFCTVTYQLNEWRGINLRYEGESTLDSVVFHLNIIDRNFDNVSDEWLISVPHTNCNRNVHNVQHWLDGLSLLIVYESILS